MSKQLLRCSVIIETEAGRTVIVPIKLRVDVATESEVVATAVRDGAIKAVEALIGDTEVTGLKVIP